MPEDKTLVISSNVNITYNKIRKHHCIDQVIMGSALTTPLLLALFLCISPVTTSAFPAGADQILIDDNFKSSEIGHQVEFIEDTGGRLTIADIPGRNAGWKQSASDSLNFGFTRSVYWFRFNVINNRTDARSCYFEINYPMLDFIEMYTPDAKGGFEAIKAGDHYPFYQREIIDRNFIFELKPNPGKNTYYFRIETSSSLNFKPILWSPYAFSMRNNTEQPIMFIYYGFMIIMIIYNFFIFLWIRNAAYLYYSLFIFSFTVFQAILNGYAYQYLWPKRIWWANNCLPFAMGLTLASVTAFLKQHVNTSAHFPRINRFFVYAVIIPDILAALASLFTGYRMGITIATALAGYTAVMLFMAGIYTVHKRSRAGTFVLVGFSMLAFGVLAFVLKTFGVLPTNMVTTWSIQLGSAMVLVILSLSLADEIYVAKNQLQYMNLNLEEKVKDRTEQLNDALARMVSINEKLIERTSEVQKARDELWGEMELAKKIQTTLLPKKPVINGYEISAYMLPATMVGGDYYDIINADGRDWIVIGDVSGHGVPAGLVMMMVQTSINTIVSHSPDLAPSKLLTVINGTITKNVRMLNEDKYVTITVLATHKDGSFCFSGLHQNILVRRAATGTVDVIETNGFWIGIEDDIAKKVEDETFILNTGDVMLIFTDGITEAWKKGTTKNERNPDSDMFGEDNLIEIFKRNGERTVDEIKNSIVAALVDYQCNDDVTMVVIRRTG
jgi:serine phosphatase RsbU (regulator of sigma subunit)